MCSQPVAGPEPLLLELDEELDEPELDELLDDPELAELLEEALEEALEEEPEDELLELLEDELLDPCPATQPAAESHAAVKRTGVDGRRDRLMVVPRKVGAVIARFAGDPLQPAGQGREPRFPLHFQWLLRAPAIRAIRAPRSSRS